MPRTSRVFALLLLPAPIAFAVLAVAYQGVPRLDAFRFVFPESLVTFYGFVLFLLGAGDALGQAAKRRGGRAGLRLRLLLAPLLTLCVFVIYYSNLALFIWRPDAPAGLSLGVAALSLAPPLGLLAYAAHAERRPSTVSVEPADG